MRTFQASIEAIHPQQILTGHATHLVFFVTEIWNPHLPIFSLFLLCCFITSKATGDALILSLFPAPFQYGRLFTCSFSSPAKAVEIRLSIYFLIFLELTSSCISQLLVTYFIGPADFYSRI